MLHGPPNEVPRERHKGQGEHGDGHRGIMVGSEDIRRCGLCPLLGFAAAGT
jgi:hypothetical protein